MQCISAGPPASINKRFLANTIRFTESHNQRELRREAAAAAACASALEETTVDAHGVDVHVPTVAEVALERAFWAKTKMRRKLAKHPGSAAAAAAASMVRAACAAAAARPKPPLSAVRASAFAESDPPGTADLSELGERLDVPPTLARAPPLLKAAAEPTTALASGPRPVMSAPARPVGRSPKPHTAALFAMACAAATGGEGTRKRVRKAAATDGGSEVIAAVTSDGSSPGLLGLETVEAPPPASPLSSLATAPPVSGAMSPSVSEVEAATKCAVILDAPAVRRGATRPHMRLLQAAVAKSAASRASATGGIRATHGLGESARLPSSPPPEAAPAKGSITADASATEMPAATLPVAPGADDVALRARLPARCGTGGGPTGPSGGNASSHNLKALFAKPDGLLPAAFSEVCRGKVAVSLTDSVARVAPGAANSQSRVAPVGRRTGSRSRSPVREVQHGPGRQRDDAAEFDPSARVPARAVGGSSSHSASASLMSRSMTERMSGAPSVGIAAPVTSSAQVTIGAGATPGPLLQRRRSLLTAAVSGIRADRAQLSASSAGGTFAMAPHS